MWEYGVGLDKGNTSYFESKQQAQWFYLCHLGEGKKPFAFEKVDGVYRQAKWNPTKILNGTTAPFKVVAVVNKELLSFNFISAKLAVKKVLVLGSQGIKSKIYANINGFDFVEIKIKDLKGAN